MATIHNTQEIAQKIKAQADKLGWKIRVCGKVLTIVKDIEVHDNASFAQADGEYYDILSLLPTTRPGSTWGTDGGGIGAVSAMRCGVFTMNKSGGNMNVLKALGRL
ncbi:MAG: hypothetical protein GY934_13430 [Gammaproteobacteria bacterium]|nr:hypothetical protein [Gammaproteobacteria bacterium]